MSIKFEARQCKIPKSRALGKWFAQMVSIGTVNTEQLAEELSHSSSVTHADLIAVLYALAVAIRQHLLQSETVHLDGLGSMRIGIKSHIVDEKEKVGENLIYAYRVIFTPDKVFNMTEPGPRGGRKGFYTKKLIKGIGASKMKF